MEMNYHGSQPIFEVAPSRQPDIVILQQEQCLTPVPLPNAQYVASTTVIDISSIPNDTVLNSITDGTQTVTFTEPVEKLTVPNGGWQTWSSPPVSESATPSVLFTNNLTQTLSLSVPVSIFGFELEPNLFSVFTFTADFFSGNTLVGSITRDINGFAGARLIAGITCGPCIDRVVITGEDTFAIAQVRYAVCANRGVDFSKLDIEL